MYFQLTIDILYDFGIDEPKDLPMELDFINGSLITVPVANPLVFTTNAVAGDIPPDFWGEGMPAMSKRFVTLLEGAGVDNIQKFPAIVRSEEDETVWNDYFAVNILGMIKCVDFSKSKYTEIFPGHYDFDVIAIDAEKAKGALLFRLQENPGIILIHKSVGKYIGEKDKNRELVGWKAKKVIQ